MLTVREGQRASDMIAFRVRVEGRAVSVERGVEQRLKVKVLLS